MNTDRTCGCKSFNSCTICEDEFKIPKKDTAKEIAIKFPNVYLYDIKSQSVTLRGDNDSMSIPFPGIQILEHFISEEQESLLTQDLDLLPWDSSQSGRRKQNFGPRANFKKRKTKVGPFKGFPKCTEFIQTLFQDVPSLEDYKPVEQCSIEYKPETGAHIEPHIDDCWIWGERIVQLNLLSDSNLTLIPYTGGDEKYNLNDLKTFPRVMNEKGDVVFNPFKMDRENANFGHYQTKSANQLLNGTVIIPLPKRSLLVMYGESRYDWEHCILRRDIGDRRIVIAYRELTPPYLPGGKHEDVGKDILQQSYQFWC